MRVQSFDKMPSSPQATSTIVTSEELCSVKAPVVLLLPLGVEIIPWN